MSLSMTCKDERGAYFSEWSHYVLVMGRYTENTEQISDILKKNDRPTDTDVGIWNTEKYRIPTL